MFAEKGSFSEIPTIKVLLSIFEMESTGILYMKNDDLLKVLYFKGGSLIWAMSNAEEDRLEDILIAKKLVDNETIIKVQAEEVVSVSIGKALVERGLISLEQLIESTKLQLRMIVRSVLKWDQGGYQFVKETPPERLFTLDMNVMTFSFNYIMREIDMTVVWREIRSGQAIFSKTADEDKIDKYGLTDREKTFLANFEGGIKLDVVLKRFGGSDRDSLLKIVYFFLVSGMVTKDISEVPETKSSAAEPLVDGDVEIPLKTGEESGAFSADIEIEREIETNIEQSIESDSVDKMDFEVERGGVIDTETSIEKEIQPGLSDDFHIGSGGEAEQEFIPPPEPESPPLSIPDEPEPVIQESQDGIEIMGLPEEPREAGDAEEHFFEQEPPVEPSIRKLPEEEDLDVDRMVREDKKKNKQFNFLMLFVILILIVSGIIFLLLQPEDEPETVNSEPGGQEVVQVQEQKPIVPTKKPEGDPIEVKMKKEASPDNQAKESGKTTPLTVKESQNRRDTKVTKPDAGSLKRDGRDAAAHFKEGNFIRAGELWEADVRAANIKFAILLELDCLKESVTNAYNQLNDKRAFYILNRRLQDRNCFLVLWGKFNSESEAAAAMELIPLYFRRQDPPARVVNLRQYL